MRKNLHSFSPGSTSMMFGLSIHSSANDRESVEHRHPATADPEEQIEKPATRFKISWRPSLNLRWRFVQK